LASDLGVPLVGVGLFYRNGYFRQRLSLDGWQQEQFPTLDPYAMALTLCEGTRIRVDLAGESLTAQIWRADVGAPLFLDADIDENRLSCRHRPSHGGDAEHRIRQEIPLGIGVRALRWASTPRSSTPTRPRQLPGLSGCASWYQPVWARGGARGGVGGCVFTTHAGAGRHRPLRPAGALLKRFVEQYGATVEYLCLGLRDDEPDETRFNMAVIFPGLAGRPTVARSSRRQPGDVPRPVPRAGRGGPHRRRHQRRTPRRGFPEMTTPARCCRIVTTPPRRLGAVREIRDELWRARAGRERMRHRDRLRRCWSRACRQRRGVDRRGARPEDLHHRLRPPLRHHKGPPSCCPSPSG
jgi:hypothetical protein